MSELKEVCKEAISYYGVDNQLNVAIEEMSELTKEICKIKRNEGDPLHVAEEIADVEIMLEQLKIITKSSSAVESLKDYKLRRLLKRMSEEG